MLLSALIVDDEASGRVVLAEMLARHAPQVTVLAQAASAAEAEKLIAVHTPDLLFMDIKMPGRSGLEVVQNMEQADCGVIFVTAFADFALQALKQEAVDYILKPIDRLELIAAVDKAARRIALRRIVLEPESYLQVHRGASVVRLPVSDLLFLEASDNYSIAQTTQGERLTLARTLKEIESDLPASFLRISRNILINLRFVEAYSKTDPFEISLRGGFVFEISRRRRQMVLASL